MKNTLQYHSGDPQAALELLRASCSPKERMGKWGAGGGGGEGRVFQVVLSILFFFFSCGGCNQRVADDQRVGEARGLQGMGDHIVTIVKSTASRRRTSQSFPPQVGFRRCPLSVLKVKDALVSAGLIPVLLQVMQAWKPSRAPFASRG